MKIRTTGSSTPLITCETRIIRISGKSGNQHDAGADHDQQREQPVKDRRLAEPLVHAGFETQAFAHRVGRGERQDAGGEQRRVEQAGGEQQKRVLAEWLQALARLRSASLMSRGPNFQIAPAQATMMKNAITDVTMQPTITSIRDSAYSLAVTPFSTTAACR